MYKLFCDICGKEIKEGSHWSRYKLKRLEASWGESLWINLHVHDSCYKEMSEYIKNKKGKNE